MIKSTFPDPVVQRNFGRPGTAHKPDMKYPLNSNIYKAVSSVYSILNGLACFKLYYQLDLG